MADEAQAGMTAEQKVKVAVPDAHVIPDVMGKMPSYHVVSDSAGDMTGGIICETHGEAWTTALYHPQVVAFEREHRPSVGEEKAAPMMFTKRGPRDWAEDSAHENGNYECRCCTCGNSFIGHKRRVQCKSCAAPEVVEQGFREWFANMTDGEPLTEDISKQMRIVAHAAYLAGFQSAPSAEGKVTYRADLKRGSDWAPWIFYGDGDTSKFDFDDPATRLVKITTYEQIVAERKREQ